MSKKPGVGDSTQTAAPKRVVPKRQLSKWERERKRRRILGIIISVVIAGVLISGGVVAYWHLIRPWDQPIVKVNGKVYDMGYFVKVLRLWGADQYSYSQAIQLAYYVADSIRDNELIRQRVDELGINITDDEIEEEFRSQAGYDPESETPDEFNQRVEEVLKDRGLSLADFKQLSIEPVVLQNKLLEAIGDDRYPVDNLYDHVQVHAILLGTEEDAEEARGKWGEGIEKLVEEYSLSHYYPDVDSVEWLPQGIESSAFEAYAFDEGNVGSGVSEPIQDTAYYTQGGYWLIMVLDSREGDEGEELHLQGILLDSEKTANEVKVDLEGEGDFAELAEEYSLHSSSKSSGGDMGWISVDDVESRFGEDALELGEDEISEPVFEDISKQSGYWLIKVLDTKEDTLIEGHRDTLVSEAYGEWLEEERNSEENEIVNYLDSEEGYEKILWALARIYEE